MNSVQREQRTTSGLPAWSSTVNALLGAVVTVVTSPVPFSPILGGLAAGYLDGRLGRSGVRAGAVSGLIAVVPLLLFLGAVGSVLSIGLFAGGASMGLPRLFGVFFLFAFGVVAVYSVGLSALGGYVGGHLAARQDDQSVAY
jgi:hypothetical protein